MPNPAYTTDEQGGIIKGKIQAAQARIYLQGQPVRVMDIPSERYPTQINHIGEWLRAILTTMMNPKLREAMKKANGLFDHKVNDGRGRKDSRDPERNQNKLSWIFAGGHIDLIITTIGHSTIHHRRRVAEGMPYNHYMRGTNEWDEHHAREIAWKAEQAKLKGKTGTETGES